MLLKEERRKNSDKSGSRINESNKVFQFKESSKRRFKK